MDMDKKVRQALYHAFQELLEDQFKEFKWRLPATDNDEKSKIPRGLLEKAEKQDVVDLMCSCYGEDRALSVCIHVLEEISVRDVAAKLKEAVQQDAGPHQVTEITDYRIHIKTTFQTMKDPNSRLGEYVHLNERYSKLIIIGNHHPEKERELEIKASGWEHDKIMKERASSSTTTEKLFKPDKYGLIPQVVILQGAAGIGKTTTARKIMFDWASEQLYQDMFDYAFYIHCREMNFCTEEKSIVDIMLKWLPSDHEVKHKAKELGKEILQNPKKLLFIIDGFDELRFSIDQPEDCLCTDPWRKEPMEVLLSSLFRKKLLPESYLIITTRPTALEKIHQYLQCSRYAEILGFSMEDREEYFHKFFQNEDRATRAFRHVEQNDTLFTMCLIPLVCWIICTVMKGQMERGEDLGKASNTLTAVYMQYLYSLFKYHHGQSKENFQVNWKGLCSLAADGIWKQKILFWEEEIKKHGLDQEDSLPLFLNENIFKREVECVCTYSFIHLSFQEFFAALHYVLEEGEGQRSEKTNRDVRILLKCYENSRHNFEVTVLFIFGLLNEEERMKVLKEMFGWKISPKIKDVLLEWVKKITKNRRIGNSTLVAPIFWCLYEIQDENFVKQALDHITELYCFSSSQMEIMAMVYCLEHCYSLECFDLFGFRYWGKIDEDDEEFCSELQLDNETHQNHKENLERLCTAMKSPRSNFRKLRFQHCDLTAACCGDLASILSTSQTLTELYLERCLLKDFGLSLLCSGLKHPNCRLQKLRFQLYDLTAACCGDLASVLSTNQTLRKLAFSLCPLKDSGVHLLCTGLKHPNCRLQKLTFYECHFTGACCGDLAQVLTENQSLQKLSITTNQIEDTGVKVLCEGLKHPKCNLQVLHLAYCSLTVACCGDLAQVLVENQRLKELDLSGNELEDGGVKLLCEGLRHPNNNIRNLSVVNCSLTAACCGDLAEVLTVNQRLKELSLFQNEIEDAGVEVLCEGLKHPDCKLEELDLIFCSLTGACCRALAEVLTENQRLKKLLLSGNSIEDTGEKLLLEGFKHPKCNLQVLDLLNTISHCKAENGSTACLLLILYNHILPFQCRRKRDKEGR
ncbi:NACHT, LRR and PYD domains-containing protein 3-like [Elgaria multicarinata webbii]|uniref:NACHT, LRR and PYD domains-containing protein 3-like n=1 Tax=Elgaria multicarinata webbii TaxID=159646 RepID=UPI002FCD6A28